MLCTADMLQMCRNIFQETGEELLHYARALPKEPCCSITSPQAAEYSIDIRQTLGNGWFSHWQHRDGYQYFLIKWELVKMGGYSFLDGIFGVFSFVQCTSSSHSKRLPSLLSASIYLMEEIHLRSVHDLKFGLIGLLLDSVTLLWSSLMRWGAYIACGIF